MTPKSAIRIPAKCVLFGEWAVLEGSPSCGIALDKYLSVSTKVDASLQEPILTTPSDWATKVFEFLKKDSELENAPLKISLERGWALQEGLGSSSALYLGLAKLFQPHWDFPKLRQKLIELQNGFGSGIDLAISYSQKPIRFENGNFETLHKFHLPKGLALWHTGDKWKTADSAKKIFTEENFEKTSRALDQIAYSSGKFLESPFHLEDWIMATQEHFEALKTLGAIPEELESLMAKHPRASEILAWKTTGAGGGDALLVLFKEKAFAPEYKNWTWTSREHFLL